MEVVTCDGEQLGRILSVSDCDDYCKRFIGFKYMSCADFKSNNMFSLVVDRNRLVGVLKYSIEERFNSGFRGILRKKFLYVRLYYIDIRSDKKSDIREDMKDLIVNDFCDVVNNYGIKRKMVNLTTLKGDDFNVSISNTIKDSIDYVKFVKKRRKKYGK